MTPLISQSLISTHLQNRQMTDHSMAAVTKNNGGGSNNHLSWLQHGSAFRQAYNSQNSSNPVGSKDNVTPIVFVAITGVVVLLRLICCGLHKEEEEEAGGGERAGHPPLPLVPSSRARGLPADMEDPFPAAALEMAKLSAAEPPLVCTYRKADGWGDDDSCGVCLAELADGEALRVLPACLHFFHAACVNEWLRRHDTCPLCRSPLVAPADTT